MKRPEEFANVEFGKGFKGYNTAEVDEYVSALMSEYTELYAKYSEIEQKLNIVVEKYKQASGRAAEAMSGVKQMSEAIIADAQTEGEKILSEANAKAAQVNAAMKESCSEILGAYADTFESEKKKLIALEEKSKAFRESLLEAYKKHIADIQGEFPSVNKEEIENVNFESCVADAFKDKLSEKKADDAESVEI